MGLHILGDSHGLFNFAGVAGATIHFHSGVTMHRAARDGIRSLLPRFFRLRSDDALVLVFGEVDCRAHIPRLSKKHGRSSLEETDALCARFAAAVHDFKGTTTATVATCSVVPFCHGHREKALRKRCRVRPRCQGHSRQDQRASCRHRRPVCRLPRPLHGARRVDNHRPERQQYPHPLPTFSTGR